MNCILIPTYPPHFQYARKLIDSIRKFCQEDVTIYVATSTGEVFEHEHVLNFKGIISSVLTIDVNESELLTTVGHHSFQSIKKILCVRYLSKQYKHVYVLDSEGLFLRPFLLSDIVSTKRIFYNSRQRHEGEYEASTYARILLKTNKCVPGWFTISATSFSRKSLRWRTYLHFRKMCLLNARITTTFTLIIIYIIMSLSILTKP